MWSAYVIKYRDGGSVVGIAGGCGLDGRRSTSVHQLFIDFKKAYDSVRREVLYSILIEFGIPMKLVRLSKTCLNETYSKVRICKHLSDSFPIQLV
jgi:hypothetical protein